VHARVRRIRDAKRISPHKGHRAQAHPRNGARRFLAGPEARPTVSRSRGPATWLSVRSQPCSGKKTIARARIERRNRSNQKLSSGRPDSRVDEIPRTIFNIDYVEGTVRNRLMADSALLRGLDRHDFRRPASSRGNDSLATCPRPSYALCQTPPTFDLNVAPFQPRSIDRRTDADRKFCHRARLIARRAPEMRRAG